jgi:hypothetical protein
LDFKKGFLIYHVQFKKVSTNVINSTFPASSNLSGDDLSGREVEKSITIGHEDNNTLGDEDQILDDVLNNVFWQYTESHWNFLRER